MGAKCEKWREDFVHFHSSEYKAMAQIHAVPLKRRYYAPAFSGTTLFVVLVYIGLIIFSFLVAYFSNGTSFAFSICPIHYDQ